MRRYNLALIAITASLGLSTAAVAGEATNAAPAATNPSTQTAQADQSSTQRKPLRRIKRAGTSTAGANSFLPGFTFFSAMFASTAVATTTMDFDFPAFPTSPE